MPTFGAGLPQVRQMQDILYMLMAARRESAYYHFAAARCACATQHNPATLYPGRERLDVRTACLLSNHDGTLLRHYCLAACFLWATCVIVTLHSGQVVR